MAQTYNKSPLTHPKTTNVPRHTAPADLHYNPILASDNATSSEEDTDYDEYCETDVHPTIGVSIGRDQTRFNSPTTPAAEKAAVLDAAGGFFSGLDGTSSALTDVAEDDVDDQHTGDNRGHEQTFIVDRDSSLGSSRTRDSVHSSNQTREPKNRVPCAQESRSQDGPVPLRPRATSQPGSKFEAWQKSFLGNLTTKSRSSSLLATSHASEKEIRFPRTDRQGPDSSKDCRSNSKPSLSEPNSSEEVKGTIEDLPPRNLQLQSPQPKPPLIKRASSDTSIQRTFSRVSSLGDDTRFADVNSQVNSRFKALKDSLQDSRLNLGVASLTSELFRERGSVTGHKKSGSRSNDMRRPDSRDITTKSSARVEDPMTRQPWPSAKSAMRDTPLDKSSMEHPHLNKALSQLEGDLVILGGYRGSILRSAERPHRQLWVPIKVGLNLRKVDLEVGIEEDADQRAAEKVIPSGMLKHIGPVDISRRLFKRLRSCDNARSGKLRVHDYGYDWRLHPAHLSRQLVQFLERLPSSTSSSQKGEAGATVIAHSLGGLITRHAVNQRPDLFKGVIYAGTPTTCVNILGPLRNGDEVLLSDKVLTAQVNFTLRTSFALLPLSGRCFIDKNTNEEYPLDFFDPQTWIDYRLSPCVARPLRPLAMPPPKTGISGYVSSVTSSLPNLSLPNLKHSLVRSLHRGPNNQTSKSTVADAVAEPEPLSLDVQSSEAVLKHGNIDQVDGDTEMVPTTRTAVSIPPEDAIAYLTRTLATVKKFKQELDFVPGHHASNKYPPISVIYGKTTPTVFGARVDGRNGIKHADAFDDLAFASGDGVVLARAAMVPEGYRTVKGGVVSSERGHVTLLGDLEAVGKCLNAIMAARARGVGNGNS